MVISDKDRKRVLEKITELGNGILYEIEKGKIPTIEIPVRALSNVKYDEINKILTLGDKTFERNFLNIAHVRRFMQTLLVAAKCKELVQKGKTASIRELYYELKHNIPGSKENTFEGQEESDPVVEDLETSLGVLREHLGLKADADGRLFGKIVIEDSGDKIDCSKLGKSGLAIPSVVDDYKFIKSGAKFILAVETKAMVDRLVEEKFHLKNDAIIVATGGQPARGTRRLIHLLHKRLKIPVYVFCDGDPWGYYIYSVIKAGSMNLAYESRNLATPSAKLVGMTISDVDEYKLQKVTEKLKDVDKGRIKQLRNYPWFQTPAWTKELNLMEKKGVRIEQQALASKSLEFVADKYLPKKIKNKEFL
jgi:DNA topoisomerase-6 subunit A